MSALRNRAEALFGNLLVLEPAVDRRVSEPDMPVSGDAWR
jgi:hypothetical protein